jgi:hypothetical protein
VKTEHLVYVLTGLAAVVVVLTRLQLTKEAPPGRHQVGLGILNAHSACAVLALVGWIVFLVGADDLVGIVALAFWWVTALAGLLILLRWLPSGGRHATGGGDGAWWVGPGLSVLGHVGMMVGVLVFTWYYVSR